MKNTLFSAFLVIALIGITGCGEKTSSVVSSEGLTCPSIENVDVIINDGSPKTIVFGEIHGTNQSPKFVGDVLCHALKKGLRVTLALEYPDTEKADISNFLEDKTGQADADFLQSKIWTNEFTDGRSSQAMWDLFKQIKLYKQQGFEVDILPIIHYLTFEEKTFGMTNADYSQIYEEQMAANILTASGDKIFVLVGNYHAKRGWAKSGEEKYQHMAEHLPKDESLLLNAHSYKGTSWNCRGRTKEDCKAWKSGHRPHDVEPITPNKDRDWSIQLFDTELDGYDGVYVIGSVTASPPAISQENP